MGYEENVRKVVPYTPGEQPGEQGIIKLNTNENPYPPAPGVQKALKELKADRLKLYPDPRVTDLVNAIADYHNVNPEQVFVGVGSDDVLAMAFLTFFNSGKPVLFPDITYSFYEVWAELFHIPYRKCALNDKFELNIQDYLSENGGVIFPNPNAPTGILQSLDFIRDILEANRDVAVIIDEAYIDFGGETCLPLIKEFPNLLVVRTFSKSRSLAGLRIGYAVGNEKMIRFLNDVKFSFNSYTMNVPSIRLGVESIRDEEYFVKIREKLIATRETVKEELSRLGFTFPDSCTNFIFAKHERCPAGILFEELKKEGIYVRFFDQERIDNYLRITVGTDEQMKILLSVLKTIISRL